jgi:hypothetical protein
MTPPRMNRSKPQRGSNSLSYPTSGLRRVKVKIEEGAQKPGPIAFGSRGYCSQLTSYNALINPPHI